MFGLNSGVLSLNNNENIIITNRYNEVIGSHEYGNIVFTLEEGVSCKYTLKDIYDKDTKYHKEFYLLSAIEQPSEIRGEKESEENKYYRIVDSGNTLVPLCFCSNGVLCFVSKDETFSQLMTIDLMRGNKKDTVISLKKDNPDNILLNLSRVQSRFKFLLNDSLLVSFCIDIEPYRYKFYKILQNNQYEIINEVITMGRIEMCSDYSQIFIEKFRKDKADKEPYIKILIYDVSSNTLTELGDDDSDHGYYTPRRSSKNEYLFFIKYSGNDAELWAADNKLNQELVFKSPFPDSYIDDFELRNNEIVAYIIIRSGEKKGRHQLSVNMPKPH